MAKCLTPYILPGTTTEVPCGKCINCCYNYSREWSLRIYHEFLSCDKKGFMLTLTYKETDGNLNRKDVQDFIKRFRTYLQRNIDHDLRIRYFYSGEYGGKGSKKTPFGRPHYHCCIFGWIPDDLKVVAKKGDYVYFSSKTMEKIWNLGFVSIGKITLDSARYVAKYLCKIDPRPHDVKPFVGMSLKPGLGYAAIESLDLNSSKLYVNGQIYRIPNYYLNVLEKEGVNVEIIKARRRSVAGVDQPKLIMPADIAAGSDLNEKKINDLFLHTSR